MAKDNKIKLRDIDIDFVDTYTRLKNLTRMASQLIIKTNLITAKHLDNLRLLVFLRGYSFISCGRWMKDLDQQQKNYDFNIDMSVQGISVYSNLYQDTVAQLLDPNGKKIDV